MVKKIKEEKTPEEILEESLVPEDEQPFEIPGNWRWIKLSNICKIISGKGFNKSEYSENGAKLLRITNVTYGQLNWEDTAYLPLNYLEKVKELVLQENDLVIALNRPITNNRLKVSLVPNSDLPTILYQRVGLIRPILNKLYTKFLFLIMISNYFKNEVQKRLVGSDQPYINLPELGDIYITLPPLPEQKRIIDKLESMLGKINEARELIEQAQETFKNRRSAILAKAFSGVLTAKWRENHPEVESSELLLNRIHKQREERYGKDKKAKKLYEFNILGKSAKISSWMEVKLENLIYIAGRIGWKGLKAEEYVNEGPMLLSVYNLNYGKNVNFLDPNTRRITAERYEESPEIKLEEDDILLTKDGAGIGKIGIIKGLKEPATVNSSLLVIRSKESFTPDFLYYFLSGPEIQRVVNERITGSTTPHLFQRDIKEFILSVPPLEEQKEIVRIIEHLLTLETEAKELIDNMAEELNLLEKSILSKAFRGELGTNNPDESNPIAESTKQNEQLELLSV